MSEADALGRSRQEACDFLRTRKTLELASTAPGGVPVASYAPFVLDTYSPGHVRAFYVYVSQLAPHTPALQANPQCAVMLIEDESHSPELFARRRLTFACEARHIPRVTPSWEDVMARFETEFGGVISLIRPLEDFLLFELVPAQGSYVRGFGKAFRFECGVIASMAPTMDGR